ncbi:Cystatin/monellin superfamily protein [Hirschfeldia incana]|nr:Cystatin/monellin superfamily protein [Hirschfeldia incana]
MSVSIVPDSAMERSEPAMERSNPPSPKRQKTEEEEEETTCFNGRPDDSDFDSEDCSDGEMELFDQELDRSGGYEIDFKKFRYCFGWRPFHLDDVSFFSDPETNRHFVAKLVNLALDQHNEEKKTSLELGKILIANFHPSCGMTFYISFEVNDPSDSQTKPYRAVVRYFPGDIEVISCNPKEESC